MTPSAVPLEATDGMRTSSLTHTVSQPSSVTSMRVLPGWTDRPKVAV